MPERCTIGSYLRDPLLDSNAGLGVLSPKEKQITSVSFHIGICQKEFLPFHILVFMAARGIHMMLCIFFFFFFLVFASVLGHSRLTNSEPRSQSCDQINFVKPLSYA